MKAFVIAVLSFLLAIVFVSPASAALTSAASYGSCSQLLKDYPDGVAKNQTSRKKATRDGYERPAVNRKIFQRHSARLDRNNNGVLCEQKKQTTYSEPEPVTPYNASRDFCLGAFTIDRDTVPSRCNNVLRDEYSIQQWCIGAEIIYGRVPTFC